MAKLTNCCKTPCSPSMTEGNPMDTVALSREVHALRERLNQLLKREAQGAATGEKSPALLVARIVPNMTLEDWQNMAKELPEEEAWFALPMDAQHYPNLAGFTGKLTGQHTDQGILCQTTGLLLTNPFMEKFEEHIRQSRTNSSDLVFILFELSEKDKDLLVLMSDVLRAHTRGCDVLGYLGETVSGEHRLALLMPGGTALRARGFAERLMVGFVESASPRYDTADTGLPLKAGLVCFDIEGGSDTDSLMDQVEKALAEASPGTTKTYRKGGAIIDERLTQVQAGEKLFLFGNNT